MGQQSILHAVKIRHVDRKQQNGDVGDSEGSRPMNETLVDWQLTAKERKDLIVNNEDGNKKQNIVFTFYFTFFV